MRGIFVVLTLLVSVPTIVMSSGCTTALVNRDPTGETFPRVMGQSLEKQSIEMPTAFAGQPAVLLIGYQQATQFDIDRWMMGLMQAGINARMVEIPTIPGLLPSFTSRWIDDGMRSGIPREAWGTVVTLYGADAKPVAALTGTQQARLTRVIVLDAKGTIIWFDAKGYWPRKALIVAALLANRAP